MRIRRVLTAGVIGSLGAAISLVGGSAQALEHTLEKAGVHRPLLPMSASATTASAATALLAMGDLGDPSNTFWEVFSRGTGTSSWRLRTPPGVASNGGLVLSAAPTGSLEIGFLTSALLEFSPLAESGDDGVKWTPGALPSALFASPSALAAGPSRTGLALVSNDNGQSILTSSGNLSAWRTLTTTSALGRPAGCDVEEVSAVALSASSQPLLGLGCAGSKEIGVLRPLGSSPGALAGWDEIGPSVPAGFDTSVVIRLERTSSGFAALAQVQSGDRGALIAFWGSGSSSHWSESSPLPVPAGWTLKATATGGSGGQGLAVLLGSGDRRRVSEIAGFGAAWVSLPGPPSRASGLAQIGDEVDAFVVSGSHLAVWATTVARNPGWHLADSINVPVPYGSSS